MRGPGCTSGLVLVLAGCLTAGCGPGAGRASAVRRPHAAAATADLWRVVSYHAGQLEVPAAWPVVGGMHAGSCGSRSRPARQSSSAQMTTRPWRARTLPIFQPGTGYGRRLAPGRRALRPHPAYPNRRLVRPADGITVENEQMTEQRTPASPKTTLRGPARRQSERRNQLNATLDILRCRMSGR